MASRVAFRLLRSLITLLGVAVITFIILRAAPGDPVALLLGQGATAESVARLKEQYGLEQPLIVQLLKFVANVARGDLGTSIVYQEADLDVILRAFPHTLLLAIAAFAISVFIAVPVGIVSATRRSSVSDHLAMSGLLLARSPSSSLRRRHADTGYSSFVRLHGCGQR